MIGLLTGSARGKDERFAHMRSRRHAQLKASQVFVERK